MNKKVIIAIILIVVLVGGGLVWAFAGKDDTSSTDTASTSTSEQKTDSADSSVADEGDSESQAAVITFTNDGFTPSTLTVKAGTVVTVKNDSSMSVQFSSDDHPTHREDPEINMETLAAGKSGTFTATTVGTHGFHDHINDQFTGTLIVTE